MLKQKIESALRSLDTAMASLAKADAEQSSPDSSASKAPTETERAFHLADHLLLPKKDLEHLLSMSDFVCRVCEQYPYDMLNELIKLSHDANLDFMHAGIDVTDIDSVIDYDLNFYRQALSEDLTPCQTEPDLLACIRRFRNVQMASIACFDILHKQDIVRSMQKTSALADVIVSQTYRTQLFVRH